MVAPWLIALNGIIYLFVAADMAWHRQWDQLMMYSGYSFAAVGGYLMAVRALQQP